MTLRPMFVAPLVGVLTLSTPALAQDPPAPPGGFAVQVTPDLDWTWSDGYRTRFDVYAPTGLGPPTGGWPVVKVHHGSGGDRKLPDVVRAANHLAAAGYLCYAYDGRGSGQTPQLNPGWTQPRTMERELLDQAESLGAVQTLVPGMADASRWALTGFSGGGRRSLLGAAWSGRPLPLAGSVTHHPVVAAVAPEISLLDRVAVAAPGGVLAADFAVKGLPAGDPVLAALQVGDYATFAALVATPIDTQSWVLLQSTQVPVLAMFAAQDVKVVAGPSLHGMNALPASTPRRIHLSTGGHDTVKNTHERALQQDLRRRWFDRFLKGVRNGVELEAYAEVAMQPPSDAEHANLGSIWEHRNEQQWPPSSPVVPRRSYLRGNGALQTAAPPSPEAGPVLQHRVAVGYDVLRYVAEGAGLAIRNVLQGIQARRVSWTGAPLTTDVELLGAPRVSLHVDDTTGIAQITARLTHVSPAGVENWISMGTYGVRQTPGRHVIDIELDHVGHVIPRGHRIRLSLQNLAVHRPPGASGRVRWVPYFTDTDTGIVIEPAAASVLELPLRPYRASLRPRLATLSAAGGIAQTMPLSGGAARAGAIYAVFFSGSGEAPGVAIPGLPPAPLNPDAWTQAAIALQNTAAFPSTLGVLDALGNAAPGFALPPTVAGSVAGLRLTATAAVLRGVSIEAFTAPVSIVVDP